MDPYLSASTSHQIGSFDTGSGLVAYRCSLEALELASDPSLVGAYKQPDELNRLILELTSRMHERRHYIDTFGTRAGLSSFMMWSECVGRFIETSAALSALGVKWQFPLGDWVREVSCPDSVVATDKQFRAHRYYSVVFSGRMYRAGEYTECDDAWVKRPLISNSGRVVREYTAFPLTYAPFSDVGGRRLEGVPLTIYFPIGHEAVIEGSAQALTRNFVQSIFPDLPVDHCVTKSQIPTSALSAGTFNVADLQPYDATDLLVSKYLRKRGHPIFDRSLMLKLADIALAGSFFQTSYEGGALFSEVKDAGSILVETLENTSTADLVAGNVPMPDEYTENYAGLASLLKSSPRWDANLSRTGARDAFSIWEDFVMTEIARPLIESRLATAHSAFTDVGQSIELANSEELPRIELVNDSLRFNRIPPKLRLVWLRQLVLSDVVEQYFKPGSDEVLCPASRPDAAWLRKEPLCEDGCERHYRGGCGRWGTGDNQRQPNCLFRECLETFNFASRE